MARSVNEGKGFHRTCSFGGTLLNERQRMKGVARTAPWKSGRTVMRPSWRTLRLESLGAKRASPKVRLTQRSRRSEQPIPPDFLTQPSTSMAE